MAFGDKKSSNRSEALNLKLSAAGNFFHNGGKEFSLGVKQAGIDNNTAYSKEAAKTIKKVLDDQGVKYVDAGFEGLEGRPNFIDVKDTVKDGKTYTFLKVGLRTPENEQLYLSIPYGTQVAERMICKLAGQTEEGVKPFGHNVKLNVIIGEPTVKNINGEEKTFINRNVGLQIIDENGEKSTVKPVPVYEKGEYEKIRDGMMKEFGGKEKMVKAGMEDDREERLQGILKLAKANLEESNQEWRDAHPKEDHDDSHDMLPNADAEQAGTSSPAEDFDDDIPF